MKRIAVMGGIVLSVVFAAMVFAGNGTAARGANNCSRVGTWLGVSDSGTSWIATDTPGPNATVGQLALEWVRIDPTRGNLYPTVIRVTNALGVWEKVNKRKYEYTWIAYGLDASGMPVYVARESGIASMANCDHVDLTYVLQLFGPTQDISTESPDLGCFPGTAVETRMSLVQAICE